MVKNLVKKAKVNLKETQRVVFLQTLTLINSAFALVAALAWNEAVKALIDRYFQSGSSLYSRFAYAIIMTVFIVIVTTRITRIMQKLNPDDDSQN